MKNGDVWNFFSKSTIAKGPRAVLLTKVKGHATAKMVEDGTVQADHKEGNDGADEGADLGATDEQQGLSDAARKYAGRQWRYKQFMIRIHAYIIHLRRTHRAKLEEIEKVRNPFGVKDLNKQLIPSTLQYHDPEDRRGTENISTRRIAEHDEDDPEERKQTEMVRCFIDNVRWKTEKGERGGITWVEFYVYYILHGGGTDFEELKR